MTDIASVFEKLDLSSYVEVFVQNGFDTWEDVLDITESDLETLNVKIGHRRRLQREIANWKGITVEQVIASSDRASSIEPGQTGEGESRQSRADGAQVGNTGKRRYRRHPKQDKNAPERPPSAYVLFSNQVREELKPQNLSFTDIAKIVGERWQQLDTLGREPFESQATSMKDDFNAKMADYKKTSEWREYQEYLANFKASQAQSSGSVGDGKRVKLERAGESSHGSSRGSAGTPSTSAHGSPISMSSTSVQPLPIVDTVGIGPRSSPTSATGFQPFHPQMKISRGTGTPPSRPPTIGQIPVIDHSTPYSSQPAILPPIATDQSRLLARRSNHPPPAFLAQQRDMHDISTASSMSSHPSLTSQSSSGYSPLTPSDTLYRPSDGDNTPTYAQQSLKLLSIGPQGPLNPSIPAKIQPGTSGRGMASQPLASLGLDSTSRILPPPQHQTAFSHISQQAPPLQAPGSSQAPSQHLSQQASRMDGLSVLAFAGQYLDADAEERKPKPP